MESGELDAGPRPRASRTRAPARRWSRPARPLVAFNLELDTPNPEIAREVAAELREAGGGLPGVRAIGLPREGERAQVSVNVHDPTRCRWRGWSSEITRLAAEHGARPVEAELVGLAPEAALEGYPDDPPIRDFDPAEHVIERVIDERSLARSTRFRAWPRRRRSAAASTAAPRAAASTPAPRAGPRNRAEARQRARPAARADGQERRPPGRAAAREAADAGRARFRRACDRRRALLRPARARLQAARSPRRSGSRSSCSVFYVPMAYYTRPLLLQPAPAQGSARSGRARTGRQRRLSYARWRWTSGCSPSARWPRTASSSAARAPTRRSIVDPGDEAERILARGRRARASSVEGILLTHTHFDHIGAVAPVAKATGAPVWCPEIEAPVLADINSFVPWPGFGPFESYEADHTVSGGEKLELAGLEIDVIFTPGPQPRPRHLLDPRRGGDLLRRRPLPGLGRAHRPAGRRLGRRCCESIRTLVDAPPARDDRSTRATWASPRSAPSGASNPFLAELAR